ncbi:hypothetical protein T484DRAFT_1976641, partial [Baffinella frigidus]
MFHLPIADAAGKIGLCQTTFKKTCRRLGIEHWPYKKGAKRRIVYKDTQIAPPLPSLHRQSLCAPASMMSTPWTAQEQDSAMNNVWSTTESRRGTCGGWSGGWGENASRTCWTTSTRARWGGTPASSSSSRKSLCEMATSTAP